ncbi:MAG: Tex family protein [bacterium]
MENKYLLSDDGLKLIAKELGIKLTQVTSVLDLLLEGSTVPFIARYRKEATGALDEEQIKIINDTYEYQKNLEKRKQDIIRLIDEKGMLTDELVTKINACTKLIDLEDIYRPFKEKKKTKATEAIKLGLEPLAKLMMEFPTTGDRIAIASEYITDKVKTAEDAITQANYIIAEWVSDNAEYRKYLRQSVFNKGIMSSKVKKKALDENIDEKETFKIYYEYSEPVNKLKPHRVLALNRGENLDILSVGIDFDKAIAHEYLERKVITKPNSIFNNDIVAAIADSFKRLIFPSVEREIRSELKEGAENQAINIFGMNLKNLLLQSPIKGKVILGVDPAFRTGCKLAVISKTGQVLEKGVIYPNEKSKGSTVDDFTLQRSKSTIVGMIQKHKIEIICIGNGTASRETESFIADIIKENNYDISYVIVSEAGASVYSASEIAREEFPDYEVQERSAVSIARRLLDPLSELVKIEPKAIGVGQYQHDVTQSKLDSTLDFVVTDAVNKVGVNINTASKSLLTYVSGLNKGIAANIVKFRDENGPFKNREKIKKVPKLGGKAFEQAAGFLRIVDGENPLDMTSVHPESYDKAELIMNGLSINGFGTDDTKDKISKANKEELMTKYSIDKYTLEDIFDSLQNPLRDIRENYDTPKLRSDVLKLEDIKIGMELEGTVRNVVDFGCFVDCGLKHDGLLHISKMTTKFIKHPSELFSVGQLIKVYVLDVDIKKEKLSLTMLKTDK